jgi:hypothetical protein
MTTAERTTNGWTVAAVATGLVMMTTSAIAASAATLTSEAKNGEPHGGPLIVAESGDLLETVGSVAAEGANGDASRNVTSSVYDGRINTSTANGSAGGDPNDPKASGVWGADAGTHFITFDLDTTSAILGYDISTIKTI